jgi:hypothetical protein
MTPAVDVMDVKHQEQVITNLAAFLRENGESHHYRTGVNKLSGSWNVHLNSPESISL